MSDNLPATVAPIQMVRRAMDKLAADYGRLWGDEAAAGRFTRVALTAIQRKPELLDKDPQSLMGALMKAAEDRLLPDGREGALVVRWNSDSKQEEVAWQPMVYGIIAAAKRSGGVKTLEVEIAYKGEVFRVRKGDNPGIDHEYNPELVINGEEIAVYAIATLADGSKEREVMTRAQIEDVRAMSKMPNKGPWAKSWGEMARKTVIHRLAKRLPSMGEGDEAMQRVISRVEEEYPFGRGTRDVNPETGAVGAPVSTTPPADRKPTPAAAFHAAQNKARDVDPETGSVASAVPAAVPAALEAAQAPAQPAAANPRAVPLLPNDKGGMGWGPWGAEMRAKLADCQSTEAIQQLNADNAVALELLQKSNEKAWHGWMIRAGDRNREIEDALLPAAPATDDVAFGGRQAA
jgi:recombination protein RecT